MLVNVSRAFRTNGGSTLVFSTTIWLINAESCSAKKVSSRTIAPYLSGGMSGLCSHALRSSVVKRTPCSASVRFTFPVSALDGERRKTWPIRRKPIVFLAELHWHRGLG